MRKVLAVAGRRPTRAKVTADPAEAARLAASGAPVVLVGKDAAGLGLFVASFSGARGGGLAGREAGAGGAGSQGRGAAPPGACLLGVLVGDLSEPAVAEAAAEMAAELWPWARGEGC